MKTIKISFYELMDRFRNREHPEIFYSGVKYSYDGRDYVNGFGNELKNIIDMQHWSIKLLEIVDEDEFEDIENIRVLKDATDNDELLAITINKLMNNQKKIIERLKYEQE